MTAKDGELPNESNKTKIDELEFELGMSMYMKLNSRMTTNKISPTSYQCVRKCHLPACIILSISIYDNGDCQLAEQDFN